MPRSDNTVMRHSDLSSLSSTSRKAEGQADGVHLINTHAHDPMISSALRMPSFEARRGYSILHTPSPRGRKRAADGTLEYTAPDRPYFITRTLPPIRDNSTLAIVKNRLQ